MNDDLSYSIYYSPEEDDSDIVNKENIVIKYNFVCNCDCNKQDMYCFILCFNANTDQFESINCQIFKNNLYKNY